MKNKSFPLVAFVLLMAFASVCLAQNPPQLDVSVLSNTPGGNRLWSVDVTPGDPPGSLAVELAFSVEHSEFVDIVVNTAAWDVQNPGNNPFTGTVTDGLWIGPIGENAFGAFGSMVFPTSDPANLFVIETLGTGLTTLNYGEAASPDPEKGDIIAEGGINFRDYSGSITVPEPSGTLMVLLALLVGANAWRRRGWCS